MADKNAPVSVHIKYDDKTSQTVVSWSYHEDSDIDYFELEIWDPNRRQWVPYDGHYGIVKRD